MARLIDADALLDKLERLVDLCNPRGYVFSAYGIAEEIGNAPTVDAVEVVHAHWNTTDTILGKCCVCSVCGSCPTMEYKYCPYCGAKMDGDGDG